MDNKFLLPSPNFNKSSKEADNLTKLHYLTPCGMTLLPRSKQPPPMYGARGATVPAKFLQPELQSQPQQVAGLMPNVSSEVPATQYCESCDMELQTSRDLQRHLQQHEACPIANCTYLGHPSVMDKHVGSIHVTGIYSEVKKMCTPEEIAAWRAERCKRYPTVANVEQRRLAKEQRKRRGERLDVSKKRFGNVEDRKRMRQHRSKCEKNKIDHESCEKKPVKAKKRKGPQQGKQKLEKEVNMENVPEGEPLGQLQMFKGTSLMSDYKHIAANNTKPANALAGLIATYGSSDDMDDEDNHLENNIDINKKESTISIRCDTKSSTELTAVANISETDKDELQQHDQDESSDDAPEEMPIGRVVEPPIENKPEIKKDESPNPALKESNSKTKHLVKLKKVKSGLDYRISRIRNQNTMLQKLLESDIRHERNVLLQCVRFVCENKFFGIGQDTN